MARLLFCRIMLQKPNVLVLDEPTNHLDLESINALNVALQRYEGTVFLVTHDQDLLEEVGTRVWRFDQGRVVDFKGTSRGAGHIALVRTVKLTRRERNDPSMPWFPSLFRRHTSPPPGTRLGRSAVCVIVGAVMALEPVDVFAQTAEPVRTFSLDSRYFSQDYSNDAVARSSTANSEMHTQNSALSLHCFQECIQNLRI